MIYFSKKHSFINSQDILTVNNILLNNFNHVNFTEFNKNEFRGIMKNQYGTAFDLVIQVTTSTVKNGTEITLKNTFDIITNMIHLSFYLVLWGSCLFDFIKNTKIQLDSFVFKLIMPVIFTIIIIISLNEYHKKIISLIKKNINYSL